MRRSRGQHIASQKTDSPIGKESPGNTIYIFRCDESGLYAFTADRAGRALPAQIYPLISWRFEEAVTLRFDGHPNRDKILSAALDGVVTNGFYLIHTALYGELFGLSSASS
jgi:hypothetical protein